MANINEIAQRARGCLLGAAVGDALGMPLEFGAPRPTSALVDRMLPGREEAGAYTDDTEMMLALAQSLLHRLPLEPDDLARCFVAWYHTNPPDIGIHTRQVLRGLVAGEGTLDAAQAVQRRNPDSASNGSVMRCFPVALAYHRDVAGCLRDSALQSRVTHAHPECVAACAFVNAAIVHLLHGASPDAAVEDALTEAARSEVGLPPELADAIQEAPRRRREDLPNTGWVRHTVETAVWALRTTRSFRDAVVQAANLGGDADTAAAVTGALAGAADGLEAIPQAWQNAVHGSGPAPGDALWRAQHFVRLADRLLALAEG